MMRGSIVYLDWNVFNKIEHITSLVGEELIDYAFIRQAIKTRQIVVPYSNAHISDLSRGYRKTPDYINGHLNILGELTSNLCITQYWGHSESTWHYRDPHEYFFTALEDNGFLPDSFEGLYPSFEKDGETSDILVDRIEEIKALNFELLRMTPLPDGFADIYKTDPIFNVMFPRCKVDKNMMAMLNDLYSFSNLMNTDYTIYKSLKKYINLARMKMIKNQDVFKSIGKATQTTPKQLLLDETLEKYMPESNSSKNKYYNQITDEYFKLDMRGFKSDTMFPNMIDDSLHTFYGAHCTYFVSSDDKCRYKATEVYKKLNIVTSVMSPTEFRKELVTLKLLNND